MQPSIKQAKRLLAEAAERNPGPWVQHSIYTGRAAEAIARACDGLDPETALVMGTLHDIGRGEGVTDLRHVLDGYRAMTDAGFDAVARICLTHSFPVQDIGCYAGSHDCPVEDVAFLHDQLTSVEYDQYDLLIQLCDTLCLPTGFCLLEKRMIDVALRYGANEFTIEKWRKSFELKARFEDSIGHSIYDLLPGTIANTFA